MSVEVTVCHVQIFMTVKVVFKEGIVWVAMLGIIAHSLRLNP